MMKFHIAEHKYVIHPGYLILHKEAMTVFGVVGSGIFIGLWDEQKNYSGCCCFQYPKSKQAHEQSANYGNVAIRHLIKKMRDNGSNLTDLKAHLLGGASLDQNNMGEENQKISRELLIKYKIEIVSMDVGGKYGRKFLYDTKSGQTVTYKTRQLRKSDWYPYH